MKQGWEIKKLGEVCEILNGYAFKSDKYADSGTRIIRITNVQKGCVVDDEPKFYSDKDMIGLSQYNLYENDLLMSLTGNVGRVGLLAKDMLPAALNQRVACLRIKSDKIILRYLFHCLNSSIFEQEAILSASGIAQKNMSTEWLKKYFIPISPLPEQEKIVAELDCLSGIIEKKKQQLKEYDALAQSIFYEMFGNPIDNEKGWEVKKLGEVSEVTSFKRVLIEDVVESGIPFIRGTELSALSKLPNSKDYQFTLFITPEHYERVKAISGVPKIGDLLIPSINSEGLIWELDTDEPRYYKDGRVLWIHTNHQYSDSKTLKYIISNKLRLMYRELASGATFIELKLFVLRDMLLPFPPLSLQQEFASKIEAIEKQKELIKQSIVETETLFNSRMDFYFN